MKIIKPGFEILDQVDGAAILKKIEICGRVCYKSEDKITEDSAETFVRNLIKKGHESVLEHVSVSVRIICDRGVSHEIVRHRIASYSQESTRYCRYDDEIIMIDRIFAGHFAKMAWLRFCARAERDYKYMINEGISPQEARAVLPHSLKTELIMTTNLREWRHFFRLRTSSAAHPQMREIAVPLLAEFKRLIPVVFDDLEV